MIIILKEEIIQRWNEYIRKIIHIERGKPEIHKYMDVPEIFMAEWKSAVANLNKNKQDSKMEL